MASHPTALSAHAAWIPREIRLLAAIAANTRVGVAEYTTQHTPEITKETTMTVRQQIDRQYSDIAEQIATATSILELSVLYEGTLRVPTLVGIELRRRIDVQNYLMGVRG
ncbi:MAG: hypothetical protein ACXVXQ_10435 [Mycobacteriaceae bacterium]